MRRIIPAMLLALLLFGTQGCILKDTGETEVGVRTVKFAIFGESGVQEDIYAPGSTYFILPVINDWHTFDIKLQNLEFTIDAERGDRNVQDDLLFKTIDGNDLSLDVIIAYRIDPQMAPYILQHVAASDYELRQKVMRTVARSIPRDVFGELTTEQFYVASQRQAMAEEAKVRLNAILEPLGIIVESVLPKDYRFNPEYQRAIEAKKVAEQQAEKNLANINATIEEYKRKLQDAQAEVNQMMVQADAEYERAKLEIDAYLDKQKAIANAIRAEGEAEAESITSMNRALAAAGGETMVKLEIAKALQGKQIMLLPVSGSGFNLSTLNMNQLIQGLGAEGTDAAVPGPLNTK